MFKNGLPSFDFTNHRRHFDYFRPGSNNGDNLVPAHFLVEATTETYIPSSRATTSSADTIRLIRPATINTARLQSILTILRLFVTRSTLLPFLVTSSIFPRHFF